MDLIEDKERRHFSTLYVCGLGSVATGKQRNYLKITFDIWTTDYLHCTNIYLHEHFSYLLAKYREMHRRVTMKF